MKFQVIGLGDTLDTQIVTAQCADRHGDFLKAFLPLPGGDHDFLKACDSTRLSKQWRSNHSSERSDAYTGNMAAHGWCFQ